jgi:hypothetical protein
MSIMTGTDQEVLQREQCEHCAAPVAADQRYCVNCGARRSQAPDPAAAYFSEASAAGGGPGTPPPPPARLPPADVPRISGSRRHCWR